MGHWISKLATPFVECSDSVVNVLSNVRRKRKRHHSAQNMNVKNEQYEEPLPKRKKLLTTTQYIYQALFKEQKNSDITIMALDRVWNLHKIYLSQSLYFQSMFNGSWKEANEEFVHVTILDKRIKPEALDAVFGALYSDEIDIDVNIVTSILATAAMFQIDGIVDRCAEVMIENLNVNNVVEFYEAATYYGCPTAKQAAFQWLEINLLSIYGKDLKLLQNINIEMMVALVSSPSLYVMQTEFSLYTMLKIWLYFQLFPHHGVEQTQTFLKLSHEDQIQSDQFNSRSQFNTSNEVRSDTSLNAQLDPIQKYFSSRISNMCFGTNNQYIDSQIISNFTSDSGTGVDPAFGYSSNNSTCSFLESIEGRRYWPVFQALRTQYLITHQMDLKTILSDNILPRKWIYTHVLSHWTNILKIDHCSFDDSLRSIDDAVFDTNCIRCGRVLNEPGYHKWRWTGFHFGLDLILIADGRVFSIRRLHRNEHERLLSLQTKRRILVRISVTAINSQRQPLFTQKSQIQSLLIEKNEDYIIQVLDAKITYPLLVSLNILLVPPNSQAFKENDMSTSSKHNKTLLFSNGSSEVGTEDNFISCRASDNNGHVNHSDQQLPLTTSNPTPATLNHQVEERSLPNDVNEDDAEGSENQSEYRTMETRSEGRSEIDRSDGSNSVSSAPSNFRPITRQQYYRRQSENGGAGSLEDVAVTIAVSSNTIE